VAQEVVVEHPDDLDQGQGRPGRPGGIVTASS